MSSEVQRLASILAQLQGDVSSLARERRLTHASLEGGGINVYQPGTGGQPGVKLGEQYDGTYAPTPLGGPVPPTPSAPSALGGVDRLAVRWDGTFASGPMTVAPQDWSRVEVHVGLSPTPGVTFETLKGTVESPRGGEFSVQGLTPDTDHWVWLVARSQTGKFSAPSAVVGPVRVTSLAVDVAAAKADATQAVADAQAAFAAAEAAEATSAAVSGTAAAAQATADDAATKAQQALDEALAAGTDVSAVQAAADAAQAAADAAQVAADQAGTAAAQADAKAAQAAADAAQALARAAEALTAANDASAKATTALTAANNRNRATYSTSAPTASTPGVIVGDSWWRYNAITGTYTGSWRWTGSAWAAHKFGDEVLDSLTAAKIVTGRLAAATAITVGDPTTVHTAIDGARGVVIQAPDAGGAQRELIRYGREFAVIDPVTGEFLTSVDDTGVGSFQGVFTPWINLNGRDLASQLAESQGNLVNRVALTPSANIGGMSTPYGLIEVPGVMYAGRTYRIDYRLTYYGNVVDDSAAFTVRITGGNGGDTITQPATPTINSTQVGGTHYAPTGKVANGFVTTTGYQYWDATYTSRYRFLLTAGRDPGNGSALGTIWVPAQLPIEMTLTDVGPTPTPAGNFNNGGGTLYGGTAATPPPSTQQQYFVDLAPAGWASFRGNGSQRTDYNGIVQGWDPSGNNGDGGGYWYFSLPSITGNVDRVDFYSYTDHWYNNSGGTAIFNMVAHPAGANYDSVKLRQDWHQAGYPKPGGKTVILPADWWPQFKNVPPSGPRMVAITVGNSNGTNLLYYGKFQGPSARLRIWYTQ